MPPKTREKAFCACSFSASECLCLELRLEVGIGCVGLETVIEQQADKNRRAKIIVVEKGAEAGSLRVAITRHPLLIGGQAHAATAIPAKNATPRPVLSPS